MLKFTSFVKEFSEEKLITEALNTPVEFYMTEDTKMPNEIYAAFNLNGTDYGMSLVKSQWAGVYILDFYYITNKKRRTWKFKSPSDIRPCLSSVIKFFEACQPFLSGKLKGIVLSLPNKAESEKYVGLLKRVIKKSHIKSYREVPIQKTSDKARNYMFLIKKNLEPTQLFKSATFSKHFIFDKKTSDLGMDSDAMDIASEPLKVQKLAVSLEPDPVMAFGKLKVQIQAGNKLISMLDAAVEKFNQADEPIEDELDNAISDSVKISYSGSKIKTTYGKYGKKTLPLPVILSLLLPAGHSNIRKFGFDPAKVDMNNMNYVLSQTYPNIPQFLRDELENHGVVSGGKFVTPNENLIVAMKEMTEVTEKEANKFAKYVEKWNKETGTVGTGTTSSANKLDLEFEPMSTLEPFQDANNSKPTDGPGTLGFVEEGESSPSSAKTQKKIAAIKQMSSVNKWVSDKSKYSKKGYQNLVDYTGSWAAHVNGKLRSKFKSKNINYSKLDSDTRSLMEYFVSDAPKLDDAIWVYRNADLPKHYNVGENMIDAGFLSTSIRSTLGIGGSGNARMKIYLPKGTKCFPILNESEHKNENEIVLPNLSVLKVIEKVAIGQKTYYTCIMLGSAVESLVNSGSEGLILENDMKIRESKKEQISNNSKKDKNNETYDAEAKWGGEIADRDMSRSVDKMIKSGKLKIRN